MFIAIGGPQAHVTLSMTDTLFQQPARSSLIRLCLTRRSELGYAAHDEFTRQRADRAPSPDCHHSVGPYHCGGSSLWRDLPLSRPASGMRGDRGRHNSWTVPIWPLLSGPVSARVSVVCGPVLQYSEPDRADPVDVPDRTAIRFQPFCAASCYSLRLQGKSGDARRRHCSMGCRGGNLCRSVCS